MVDRRTAIIVITGIVTSTAANGLIFGPWGIVVSWVGAMLGAGIAFCIGRAFSEVVAKRLLGEKKLWTYVDRFSTQYGTRVVFVARLLPFVSFDVVSYAAGLSTMRFLPLLTLTALVSLSFTFCSLYGLVLAT